MMRCKRMSRAPFGVRGYVGNDLKVMPLDKRDATPLSAYASMTSQKLFPFEFPGGISARRSGMPRERWWGFSAV